MSDLQDGNVALPPDADTTSTLEVVPVHDDVDHQVESNGNPGNSSVTQQLGEAEEGRSTMVVGMEEGYYRTSQSMPCCYWLLVKHLLSGFFFKKRKQVSRSSRYLVR